MATTKFFVLFGPTIPSRLAKEYPELDTSGWVTINLEHEHEILDGRDLVGLEDEAREVATAYFGTGWRHVTSHFSRPDFPAGERMVIERVGRFGYDITKRTHVLPMPKMDKLMRGPLHAARPRSGEGRELMSTLRDYWNAVSHKSNCPVWGDEEMRSACTCGGICKGDAEPPEHLQINLLFDEEENEDLSRFLKRARGGWAWVDHPLDHVEAYEFGTWKEMMQDAEGPLVPRPMPTSLTGVSEKIVALSAEIRATATDDFKYGLDAGPDWLQVDGWADKLNELVAWIEAGNA